MRGPRMYENALAAMQAAGEFKLSHHFVAAVGGLGPAAETSFGDFLGNSSASVVDVAVIQDGAKVALPDPGGLGSSRTLLVSSSSLFLLLSAIWCLLYLVSMSFQRRNSSTKLPPGPRGHFLFGSLSQMTDLDAAVERWSKQYGPVFTVWLGFLPTIFVTGSKEAQELLVKQGSAFACRPHRKSRVYLTNNHRNVNTSPYGPRWRALRKNLVRGVLSNSRLAATAPWRSNHMEQLVRKLRKHAQERPEEAVPVLDNALFVAFSILLSLCFGQMFEEQTVVLFRETMKATLKVAGPNLGDFLPLVHMLINPAHYRRCKLVRDRVRAIMLPLIRQHRERRRRQQQQQQQQAEERDYVDSLLAAQERQELELEDDDILLLCNELLNAGTETSANSIEFIMAELVRLPELQNRLAEHIRSVCGDRPLSDADLPHLPLLRAVVLEGLRLHPPGNFSLPHSAAADSSFRGFHVPRRAEILVSLKTAAMDATTWADPQRFHPDRFLDPDCPPVDLTGARGGKLALIPFGAGRRVCPGLNLAMLHLHFIVGRLVQAFQWLPAKDGQLVDMTPTTLFTVKLLNPIQARIRPRLPTRY